MLFWKKPEFQFMNIDIFHSENVVRGLILGGGIFFLT